MFNPLQSNYYHNCSSSTRLLASRASDDQTLPR